MLTDTDLRELHEQAGKLSDSKIEQALRFAFTQKRFDHPDAASESERVDAWILALLMEQARRAGKFRTLSDQDGTTLARLWLQLSRYRTSLRKAGLTVEMQIKEIDNHQVRVSMVISGPPAVIEQSVMG